MSKPNKVQQRARQKKVQQKSAQRKVDQMRRIRTVATVAAVAVLGVTLFMISRGGDDKTVSPGSKPGASSGSTTATGGKAACGGDARGTYKPQSYKTAPKTVIDAAKTYTATFETSCGSIVVALDAKNAPKTVNNFVFLAREGFYDNTIFHRVIPSFMMQGGDPEGTGSGGPGYKFEDETKPTDQFDKPGILAMANSGPDTNGSQFFITEVPTPHLNGKHTIVGRVTKGLDVVLKVAKVKKDQDAPNPSVVLYKVTITEA